MISLLWHALNRCVIHVWHYGSSDRICRACFKHQSMTFVFDVHRRTMTTQWVSLHD